MQSNSNVAGGRPRPSATPPTAAPPNFSASVAARAPSPSAASPAPNRVQLLGIDERSPGIDPVLAGIFKTMRASLGVAPEDLARLLHTRPEVLAHLEAGRVRSLPPLPELVRLMKDYGALLNIETGPIITRIREQTADKSPPLQIVPTDPGTGRISAFFTSASLKSSGANWLQRRQSDAGGAAADAAPGSSPIHQAAQRAALPASNAAQQASPDKKRERSARKTKRWRWLARVAIASTFVAGAAWTAQSQPPVLYAAVNQLPPSVAKNLRRGMDMIAGSMASTSTTTRDGLTWIEAADPRRRKGDRLPVTSTGLSSPPNR